MRLITQLLVFPLCLLMVMTTSVWAQQQHAVDPGAIAGTVVQQPFQWAYQGFKLMAAYLKGDKSGIPKDGVIIVPGKTLHAADIDAYVANLKQMQGK